MIWVITCKDNSFEANTGCETVICGDGNDGDNGNEDTEVWNDSCEPFGANSGWPNFIIQWARLPGGSETVLGDNSQFWLRYGFFYDLYHC